MRGSDGRAGGPAWWDASRVRNRTVRRCVAHLLTVAVVATIVGCGADDPTVGATTPAASAPATAATAPPEDTSTAADTGTGAPEATVPPTDGPTTTASPTPGTTVDRSSGESANTASIRAGFEPATSLPGRIAAVAGSPDASLVVTVDTGPSRSTVAEITPNGEVVTAELPGPGVARTALVGTDGTVVVGGGHRDRPVVWTRDGAGQWLRTTFAPAGTGAAVVGVTATGDGFVAVLEAPAAGPAARRVARSADGVRWSPGVALPVRFASGTVAVAADGPTVLVVGGRGGDPTASSVARSTDGGATWEAVDAAAGPPGVRWQAVAARPEGGFVALGLAADDPGTGTAAEVEVHATEDGTSWRRLARGGPAELDDRVGAATLAVTPDALVVALAAPAGRGTAGLLASVDGGATWGWVDAATARLPDDLRATMATGTVEGLVLLADPAGRFAVGGVG